jgi:hypothetical protein
VAKLKNLDKLIKEANAALAGEFEDPDKFKDLGGELRLLLGFMTRAARAVEAAAVEGHELREKSARELKGAEARTNLVCRRLTRKGRNLSAAAEKIAADGGVEEMAVEDGLSVDVEAATAGAITVAELEASNEVVEAIVEKKSLKCGESVETGDQLNDAEDLVEFLRPEGDAERDHLEPAVDLPASTRGLSWSQMWVWTMLRSRCRACLWWRSGRPAMNLVRHRWRCWSFRAG